MQPSQLKASDAAEDAQEREPSVGVVELAGDSTAALADHAAPAAPGPSDTARIVAKNTIWLIAGQVLGMPLGILLNAMLARYLGAADFGLFFLIMTMSNFAATFSEFGQGGAAQRAMARDRVGSGEVISSALVLRMIAFVIGHVALAVAAWLLAYEAAIVVGLGIIAIQTLLNQFGMTATLAARAFERSDLVARNVFVGQLTAVACVVGVLLLGYGLVEVLAAHVVAAVVALVINWRLLATLGVQLRRFSATAVRHLGKEGVGFLILNGVIVLQWNVNAVMLSKMAGAEDMGWYAASQRLVGFLIFPCTAVIGSLYPTLCRLLVEAPKEAHDTARTSLTVVSWIALPVAICCALFPDIGILIFSKESFAPAEDNLVISSIVVFSLYFAMALATYLNALGLQRIWAWLQLGSVAISSVLNIFLIPHFRETFGNGGLGVITATVFSEAFLVAAGLWLAPRGLLNRAFLRTFGGAAVSGIVMAAVGYFVREQSSPWLAAPLALLVYTGCLRLTGVLNDTAISTLRDMLSRRRTT